MGDLRLSRYSFLFEREGKFLIYNSRINNFYETDNELFKAIDDYENGNRDSLDDDAINQLHQAKIFTTELEDNDFLATLQFRINLVSYDLSSLGLTIAPTIWCNLACPYCFETTKPKGIISEELCDKILEFIKSHKVAKSVNISWYGGEPLLAIDRIEYLLEKFSNLEDIKFTGHSIITNATLLKGKALEVFKKYPLHSIQVTLDGLKQTHDKKRKTHKGEGSFDTIITNLKAFAAECPDTNISIRVNVDKTNWHEYQPIVELIKKEFPGKENISVYPGILRGGYGCDIDDVFFSSKDVLEFHKFLESQGIKTQSEYPHHSTKGCSATNVGAYIIGPKGELYNCWEEVGKPELSIGNICDASFSREHLFMRYLAYGTPFSDEKCRMCGLLPLCSGGCPRRRVENVVDGSKHDLCYLYSQDNNNALFDYLMTYYNKYHCSGCQSN